MQVPMARASSSPRASIVKPAPPRVRWDDLRFVLAVHRTGTLAAAAKQLRIDATTVGRRITSLEAVVGARLVERTQEGLRLTEAGAQLLPHAERMEAEALTLERKVAFADQRLSGTVRVATTEFIAARFLAPQLPRFSVRYPNVSLVLICSPRTADLARREADVAIRLARPREPDVVTRRFWHVELALFASKTYVAERGRPRLGSADLRRHDILGFATTRAFASENGWLDERLAGARVALRSDSVSTIYNACAAGAGLGLLPHVVAARDPALVHVADAEGLEPRGLWQAVHQDVVKAPRIRAVLDFMHEILRTEPSLG